MQQEHLLLELRNIALGYAPGRPVIEIPELLIPKGQMVFMNGPSGIGKSTLLEFMGLMSNTNLSGSLGSYALIESPDRRIDLGGIWNRSDDEISMVRSQHFSFVFQSTNLMPNFTIGENMCFNLLVNGVEKKEAEAKVRSAMEALDLPQDLYHKSVTEASGGQRQRIAFVRAFSTSFSVLFGDEPTGNLDKGNAVRLLERLQRTIKDLQKTAVIVSHDQELSKEFGDLILNIVPGAQGSPNRIEIN